MQPQAPSPEPSNNATSTPIVPQNLPTSSDLLLKKIKNTGKAVLALGIFMSVIGILGVAVAAAQAPLVVSEVIKNAGFLIAFLAVTILGVSLLKTREAKAAQTKIIIILIVAILYVLVIVIGNVMQGATNGIIGVILALALIIDLLIARSQIKKLSN